MHAKENQLGSWERLPDLSGGIDSVQNGHTDVENYHIRNQTEGGLKQGFAVIDCADYLVLARQQASNALQDERVIIPQ